MAVHWVPLLESAYLFAELARKLSVFTQPPPRNVEYFVELHNMSRSKPSILVLPGDDGFVYPSGTASGPGMRSSVIVDTGATVSGQVAFEMVASIFEWYGLEHDRIPFQEEPGKISPDAIVKGQKNP